MHPQDHDRFPPADDAEFLSLLRRAAAARAPCSVRAAGRSETHLSPLRAVSDDGEPILDPPRAPVIERALTPGSVASVEIRLPDFRLSFDTRVAGTDRMEPERRLRLERPATVTKLHRRDVFRVQVPQGLRVRLTLDPSDPALVDAPMCELHLHGGSLTVRGTRARIETGLQFERARLALPDGSPWPLAVRVLHASLLRRHAEGADLRIGVQFMQPGEGCEAAVADLVRRIARGIDRPHAA
jgi:hypothetical protein